MNPTFATAAIALYVAHHVGDYWIQTDHQARHKAESARACLAHVGTYLLTQIALLGLTAAVTGLEVGAPGLVLAVVVSGGTHYLADRRAPLAWIVNHVTPWNRNLLRLGQPRAGLSVNAYERATGSAGGAALDNPQLTTGSWALDQSWHILFSVFVPALILATV